MKNVIIHGDCLEVLRKMDDNSVDSVVTDPPYGLSKEPNISEVLTKWLAGEPYDHGHGGFMGKAWDSFVPHPDVWKEVYRVLKPGGHALVFAGTRTQDLMTVSLRLGGFEIRDVIEWLYFSGFPKSMDVGKSMDKLGGNVGLLRDIGIAIREAREKRGLSISECDRKYCGGTTNWSWFEGRPKGQRAPSDEIFAKIAADWPELSRYAKAVASANREKVGEKTSGIGQAFGDGVWVSESKVVDITAAATDLAKQWDGWGTALKPAHEPIIVARKPLVGTVAETVERYGTGAINIDGCRIMYANEADRVSAKPGHGRVRGVTKSTDYGEYGTEAIYKQNEAGRFPANCVTVDDDAFYSPYFNVTPREVCKKASKADRGVGNTFPTVKPTDLMAWLVRLVTPPGGTTLDPFVGSGTTFVSGIREGFNVIGIEQEREHCDIAAARTGLGIIEISEVGETSSRQTSEDVTKEVAYA